MKMRKIISLTILLSFILLLITSVALYIKPLGRVAYWGDWRFCQLTKSQWENLHTSLGVLFVCSALLHLCFNIKSLISYLKTKSKRLLFFTAEFNIAFIIVIIFCLGTYFETVPFRWLGDYKDTFKDAAVAKFGDPPYRHAERSTLAEFAQKAGIDFEKGLENLRQAGIEFVSRDQTVMEVAFTNDIMCRQVYEVMKQDGIEAKE